MTTIKFILVSFAFILNAERVFAQSDQPLTVQRAMTPEQFRASGMYKLSASEMRVLNAWFNNTVDKALAIGRESNRGSGRNSAITIDDVIDGEIIADDGQFLGIISDNPVDPKSISNCTLGDCLLADQSSGG